MATASARHILVSDEQQCIDIKEKIESGEISFEEAARDHSLCPSGVKGGDLGTFSQGQMVPEFDDIVFSGELEKIHGPVKTQFGYHLIEVRERKM